MKGKKITQLEFEKWAESFKDIFLNLSKTIGNQGEKNEKIISLFFSYVKLGNTFPLLSAAESLKELLVINSDENFRNQKFDFPCDNGVKETKTHEEWFDYILQRVQQHHKVRVKKEIVDLDSLKNKCLAVDKWQENRDKRNKILSQIFNDDLEGYDLVFGIINFREEFSEIIGEDLPIGIDITDQENLRKNRYFLADLAETVFTAQENLRQKPIKDSKITTNEKTHQENILQEQIKKLREQNEILKNQLANVQLDLEQRKFLESQLSSNDRLIQSNEKKIGNLQKSSTGDDKKPNLAIVLGIIVVVFVALISLLIVSSTRSSRRNKYN